MSKIEGSVRLLKSCAIQPENRNSIHASRVLEVKKSKDKANELSEHGQLNSWVRAVRESRADDSRRPKRSTLFSKWRALFSTEAGRYKRELSLVSTSTSTITGMVQCKLQKKHCEGTEQVQVGEQKGSESESDARRKAMRGGKRKAKTTEFVEVIRGVTGIEATIWHSSAPIIPGYAHAGHAGKALPNDPIHAQTATLMTSREWIGGYPRGSMLLLGRDSFATAQTGEVSHALRAKGTALADSRRGVRVGGEGRGGKSQTHAKELEIKSTSQLAVAVLHPKAVFAMTSTSIYIQKPFQTRGKSYSTSETLRRVGERPRGGEARAHGFETLLKIQELVNCPNALFCRSADRRGAAGGNGGNVNSVEVVKSRERTGVKVFPCAAACTHGPLRVKGGHIRGSICKWIGPGELRGSVRVGDGRKVEELRDKSHVAVFSFLDSDGADTQADLAQHAERRVRPATGSSESAAARGIATSRSYIIFRRYMASCCPQCVPLARNIDC
ncbi:hypothetical protein C8F01DRAFT_1088560 [Mycena amicta]|nr:hypothetical protein C8F01DRAFT_1088560 [Mycena amicta]